MLKKILKELQPFKLPLIILGVFLLILLILGLIMPAINSAVADTEPIVSIKAENTNTYNRGDTINLDDFDITAVHDNGNESSLSSEDVKINKKSLDPIGETTTVEISLADDPTIKCDAEVKVSREKVVGFQCGYPEVTNVTAVLYSNGELCFEGTGDVLVCNEGEYPWFNYEGMEENPIVAVSFEEGVTPTNMNYWFESLESLTYVDKIPSSVKTMVRTFANCINLEQAADWSDCTNLLNISEVYSECTALESACDLLPSTRSAYRAYAGCVNLLSVPGSSKAEDLTNASQMYAQCTNLVEAEIGPSVQNMSGMFMDCINLKEMPELPASVQDASEAFANDVSLQMLTSIPRNVNKLTNMFYNCQLIHGELTIDCDVRDFDGMFADACPATNVNLVGKSKLLDAYANTNADGNVYVNGKSADKSITAYEDVYSDGYEENADVDEEVYEDNALPDGVSREIPEPLNENQEDSLEDSSSDEKTDDDNQE